MINEELKQQIEQEAKDYANGEICDWGKIDMPALKNQWEQTLGDYIAGATTYATKLHHSDEVNKALEETNRGLVEQNKEAKNLLNEVFQKHESGLLPDRFVYEKIKEFLYPTPKTGSDERRL